MSDDSSADFGYERVPWRDKARRVRGVFDSVAGKYDLMNDLMSAGLHRLWKRFAVNATGVRAGMKVLDLAGGTGDLTRLFADRVGPSGEVVLTDINGAMLSEGRDKLLNEGAFVPVVQCDAQRLPFPDRRFDCVSIAFGLRNVTNKDAALAEMRRVLKPGGRLVLAETYGNNRLLNWLRRTRWRLSRQPDEAGEEIILSEKELDLLKAHLRRVDVTPMNFLAMAKRLFRGRFESPLVQTTIRFLESADNLVLSWFPALRRFCGEVLVVAEK